MRRRERGTALVELALTLPIFLAVVLGLLDFGRAVYIDNLLANAARDGARFASVDPLNTSCIKTTAIQRGSIANLTAGSVTVARSSGAGTPQVGLDSVDVTVNASYTPLTPLVADLIGQSGAIPLSGSARMTIRNVRTAADPLDCTAVVAPTTTPTSIPVLPTNTSAAPTATSSVPTPTSAVPTSTTVPATNTPRPTATPVPPTPTATPCEIAPGQCNHIEATQTAIAGGGR